MQCLTVEDKDRILKDHCTTVMRRIQVNPYFMAELVKEGVMESHESQDIQAEQTPGKKCNALLALLQAASIEAFINFCIVLEVKQKRRDIVHDVFGLKLQNLLYQKDHIRQGTSRSEPTAASPVCTVPNVATVQQPNYGTGQRQDIQTTAPHVPHQDPSPMFTESDVAESIASVTRHFETIQIQECKMLHDPTRETEIHGTELITENWMTADFTRLKKCLTTKRPKPVVIALLDSGVYTEHPDLNEIKWIIESRNCVGNYGTRGMFIPDEMEDTDLKFDRANHGTMSAGIVWNCAGAENVKLMNLKVLKHDGMGSLHYVAEALNYIKKWDALHPNLQVDIILMTLGGPQSGSDTNRLLAELGEKKILVCSASNEGQTKPNSVLSPANHGSVIAIGSCNENGDRCSHSAVGQELDFLFPGENVRSTSSKYNKYQTAKHQSRYIEKSGTSFAAPYAAALMALILSYVETHITDLNRVNGTHWREVLTRSAEMKKFLRDLCCRREHSYDRGFGAPELNRINKDWIQAHLKLAYNISD